MTDDVWSAQEAREGDAGVKFEKSTEVKRKESRTERKEANEGNAEAWHKARLRPGSNYTN